MTDLIKQSVHMLQAVDTEARPPLGLTTHPHGRTEDAQQHLGPFLHLQVLGQLKLSLSDRISGCFGGNMRMMEFY